MGEESEAIETIEVQLQSMKLELAYFYRELRTLLKGRSEGKKSIHGAVMKHQIIAGLPDNA